jgi:hypothetical protein
MFIEQEPQMPSRQERRKVSVGILLALHLDERVEHHRPGLVEIELERVVARIFAAVGIVAVDLERLDPAGAGRLEVRPLPLITLFLGSANSAIFPPSGFRADQPKARDAAFLNGRIRACGVTVPGSSRPWRDRLSHRIVSIRSDCDQPASLGGAAVDLFGPEIGVEVQLQETGRRRFAVHAEFVAAVIERLIFLHQLAGVALDLRVERVVAPNGTS